MQAWRIAAAGVAGMLVPLMGSALLSTAAASEQIRSGHPAAPKVVAKLFIESVSEHETGYALGSTREVRLSGFMREALTTPAAVEAEVDPVEDDWTDVSATASTANDRIDASQDAAPQEVSQLLLVPIARPETTERAAVVRQQRQRPVAERPRGPVVAVSEEPRPRRLSLPLPRSIGVFH